MPPQVARLDGFCCLYSPDGSPLRAGLLTQSQAIANCPGAVQSGTLRRAIGVTRHGGNRVESSQFADCASNQRGLPGDPNSSDVGQRAWGHSASVDSDVHKNDENQATIAPRYGHCPSIFADEVAIFRPHGELPTLQASGR